jgi:hypothetical protein
LLLPVLGQGSSLVRVGLLDKARTSGVVPQLPVFRERNNHCRLITEVDDLVRIVGWKLGHRTIVEGSGVHRRTDTQPWLMVTSPPPVSMVILCLEFALSSEVG